MYPSNRRTGEVLIDRPDAPDDRLPASYRVQGNHPFTVVHMHQWEFIPDRSLDETEGSEHVAEGGEWLPEYTECRHVVGGNGVQLHEGRVYPQQALQGMRKKGAIVIFPGDERLGAFRNYVARYELKPTSHHGLKHRYHHVFRWVELALLRGGTHCVPVPNEKATIAFRRQLYDGGIVPPMLREHLETHLSLLRNQISSIRSPRKEQTDASRDLLKWLQARVRAMEQAYARQFGQVEAERIAKGEQAPEIPELPPHLRNEGAGPTEAELEASIQAGEELEGGAVLAPDVDDGT